MKTNFVQQLKDFYNQHPIISIVLMIIGIGIFANIWYITLPVVALIYIWKKSNWGKATKIKTSVGVLVLVILGFSINTYSNRAPVLSITNPQDNFSIQASTVSVQGKVNPSNSVVKVNGVQLETKSGQFDYKFPLNKETEDNKINIVAYNDEKSVIETVNVTRIFTDQEKADIQAKALKIQQEKDAEIAKEKAEQEAYDKSPAGRLCKKHPSWSESDCESVVSKEIWIGMSLDMVKAERGTPNDANPSNYGSGRQWQWCWHDYTPSCFYGSDNGIITGYN